MVSFSYNSPTAPQNSPDIDLSGVDSTPLGKWLQEHMMTSSYEDEVIMHSWRLL